jgi:branched-subunit amino acid aminotransferase/4-amino-4-deoxychorismate lyase
VGLHTDPLPFGLWAERYRSGQALYTTEIEQVPAACWPPLLKCRSRMHYFLADRKAAEKEPGARALLLDHDGQVTEASTANVLVYTAGGGLVSPPQDAVLPGVSLAVVARLAHGLGIPLSYRKFPPAEVARADEVILSSTPWCLLPVTRFEGRPIGSGVPGPVFARLLSAWSELAGVDIVRQSRDFAARGRFDSPPIVT